jgi:ZIP family zinc transporter
MSNFGASLAWGLAIGASLMTGAVIAARVRLPERLAATITAFGGGLLLAAVALELVPKADRGAGPALTAAGLLAGTLAYVGVDAWLTRSPPARAMRRSAHAAAAGLAMDMPPRHAEAARGESIAAGLFVDGVPESVALGLTVAAGEIGLALLVGVLVGNLVEAYGAAQPIIAGGHTKRFAVTLLAAIGVSLAVATILGGTVLSSADESIIGTAEAVASGAVLAVVTVSIVPHAFAQVSSRVAVAAVAGFIAGYLLS